VGVGGRNWGEEVDGAWLGEGELIDLHSMVMKRGLASRLA